LELADHQWTCRQDSSTPGDQWFTPTKPLTTPENWPSCSSNWSIFSSNLIVGSTKFGEPVGMVSTWAGTRTKRWSNLVWSTKYIVNRFNQNNQPTPAEKTLQHYEVRRFSHFNLQGGLAHCHRSDPLASPGSAISAALLRRCRCSWFQPHGWSRSFCIRWLLV